MDSKKFEDKVQDKLDDIEQSFEKTVTIAVVGNVSAGKSSLINALFNRSKKNPLATVGSTSGVTTNVKKFKLSKNVEIMDSPGLGDIIKENSDATREALSDIDVGILVVSDSADVSQKRHYDDLKQYCDKVFVVLNKIDMYDKKKAALVKVVDQWQEVLKLDSTEQIYQTCADGYDPEADEDCELDIRGVNELRDAILLFLKEKGKDLLLAKEMEKKSTIAKKIIYTALASVAVEAFIPGSAVYIMGTQAIAIMSIHYIYTGEKLSKKAAIAALPVFASQSIGSTAFLWAKSILPPTGILDVAAATVAVVVTLSMLSAVNWIYENGYNLDDKTELKEQFNKIKKLLEHIGAKEIFEMIVKKDIASIKQILDKVVK